MIRCSIVLIALQLAAQQHVLAQQPPVTAKKPHTVTLHGDTRVDDYAWLRDKDNPDVIAHLEAENAYTEAVMKPTEALQQTLYDEVRSHANESESDLSVATLRNGYYYYSRTQAGQQYPIYVRRKGSLAAPEEVLLDLNLLARGQKYIALGDYVTSDDNNLLAYSLDTAGNGEYTLFVKDLRTGTLLPERIERAGTFEWGSDSRTIYYVQEEPVTQRRSRFLRHTLGGAHDLLFDERDELFELRVSRTRDRRLVLLNAYSKTSNEYRFLPASDPTAPLKMVVPRKPDHHYSLDHRGDRFYIRTNDHAPNYRLVTASESDPSMAHWKEIVPARANVELIEFNVFADFLELAEVRNGNRTIRVIDLRSGTSTPVTFGEAMYNLSSDYNPDFYTTKFRYRYNSLLQPEAVYEFDMEKHFNTLLRRSAAPNYDPTLYAAERAYATAADGARVPLDIVYRKPLVRDGKRPLLLYGYGSYGVPLWPFFVRYRLPLLDRGVVFVIAHVRGGGGFGPAWRDAGRMLQKRNTFTDFVAAAEHLIREKYTSADRLASTGHSAGGLLVTAAMNLRPDLFRAVVASSPFVDVLNTMLDPSLPLTTVEYVEWGNPNKKPEYEVIRSYSPYDNIRRAAYPAVLVEVSLNDSQVKYWEGTKFAAKLRELKTDSRPVLLRVNMAGGHGGSSGRYDALHQIAFEEAFILTQIGAAQQR